MPRKWAVYALAPLLAAVMLSAGCAESGTTGEPEMIENAGATLEEDAAARAELRRERAKLRRQRPQLRRERAEIRRQRARTRERERELQAPAPEPAPAPPPEPEAAPNCHPSYDPCLDPNASDYDCAGGEGDGPEYTGLVTVKGSDDFDLDRDGDGTGCDS
jgi:hypothetical protein